MKNLQTDILTIDEAAILLKIPLLGAQAGKQRKIPAQKVGQHWRFHYTTLIDWIPRKTPIGIKFSN